MSFRTSELLANKWNVAKIGAAVASLLMLPACSSGETGNSSRSANAGDEHGDCADTPFQVYGQNDWPLKEGQPQAPAANIRNSADYTTADVLGTLDPNKAVTADGWMYLPDSVSLPEPDNPDGFKGRIAIRLTGGYGVDDQTGWVNSASVRLKGTKFDKTGADETAEASSEALIKERPDCEIK